MQVALFIPCLNEHIYPNAALSMVKVLHHFGVNTIYVDDQTCCGQPAFNSGYQKEIIPLAEKFIKLFCDFDYVIAPSGSCVSMVKNHYEEIHFDSALNNKYLELRKKIFEFTEFLIDVLKVDNLNAEFKHKVTFHDSCHALRELKVFSQPRKLMNMIKGLELIELEDSDVCCGFGGTFSFKYEDVSVAMVERKCENIVKTNAEFCIGLDSSCLMNIDGYIKKNDLKVKVIHIAELLAKSLGLE
ncbi:MAG: (Fe-S)-binding protein [Ignavibacteriales bacterium]|nr:(Fe-S)-binding protein [Ignavibacteriales bacterium]